MLSDTSRRGFFKPTPEPITAPPSYSNGMSLIAPPVTKASLDDEGKVSSDLPCVNCGYNLRTRRPEDVCPECGASVKASMREDLLSDAPRSWRDQLWLGTTLALVGVACTPVLLYVGVAVTTAGLWLMTMAQPGREEPRDDWVMRSAARGLTLIGGLMLLGLFVVVTWKLVRTGMRGRWEEMDGLILLGHAVYIVGLMATWRYIGTLAQRANAPKLARRVSRLAFIWFGGSLALGLAGIKVILFMRVLNLEPPVMRIGRFAGYFAMASVLVFLWVVTLRGLLAIRRGLRPMLKS